MSADRDGMERREGWTVGPVLPDDGPWSLMLFKDRVFTLSQISGLYEITGLTLRKIELVDEKKP